MRFSKLVRRGRSGLLVQAGICVVALVGCGSSTSSTGSGGAAGPVGSGGAGGQVAAGPTNATQLPPEGAAAVEAWLQAGIYKTWHCEAAVHEARSPSPHGFNRICSNDAVADNAAGTGVWPAGAAAVKELYDAATATTPSGYAVYYKKQADSGGGANWYWYERVPLASTAPHDANGVVADGAGSAGTAKSICVGCHVAAGSDVAHTPSVGGRDQVYTPVATAPMGNAQLPPEGAAAVEAWLAAGAYKTWHCEAAVHEARSPSPHGFNRICSNDVIANSAAAGPWPIGAAAVKELFANATATTPSGYAVYAKKQADSAAGANWYWYESVPLTSSAPHDANGVVADGPGNAGPAQTICVGCHAAAGSDVAHTPSVGGHDQVYTPVATK